MRGGRGGTLSNCLTGGAQPVLLGGMVGIAQQTPPCRTLFLDELGHDYVRTARAKGMTERTVLFRHVMRNAMIPIVTGFPAAFVGAFFAGALLIESLFSLDGLGLLSYESIIRRDYPVVLGSLFLFTLIGLVVNLISDLMYVIVDPRVQVNAVGKGEIGR